MLARSLTMLLLVTVQLMVAPAASALARTIAWSGYGWDVRPPGLGAPGPNHWSDSAENVRVDGSDLVLSIVKDGSGNWTSAEVDNQQHLGYGTYRWVVASDLSALDAYEVLGMFTYGGAARSNNEIDIEPSHWGNLASPTGSATVWQDPVEGRRVSHSFAYSDRPPYVNQFTWEPGRIRYLVTDAAGATLLDATVTTGVPVPSSEVPIINYWRFENAPPAGVRSMRIASFRWAAPGHEAELPGPAGPGAASTSPAQGTARTAPAQGASDGIIAGDAGGRPWRCTVAKSAAASSGGAAISWTAAVNATLRLAVSRRVAGDRYLVVRTQQRVVRQGTGRARFSGRLGGRRLRPGSYRLAATLTAGTSRVRCGPAHLRFSVPRS